VSDAHPPPSEVLTRLAAEQVLRLDARTWASLADAFVARDRHPTGLAGDLVVAEAPPGLEALVGIETPESGDDGLVVYLRLFADETEAGAWVARRLAQYERMWDG
jgi:hypothetical protein